MAQVNVIGAGIAGSIVARMLRAEGIDVLVFDDVGSFSASQASSNLYVASWMAKFKDKGAANGIRIIEEMFGGNDMAIPAESSKIDNPFQSGIANAMKVKHIAQRHLLVKPDIVGTVTSVSTDNLQYTDMQKTFHFRGLNVVCAGHRHCDLVPGLDVWVKVGHCYLFEGELAPGQSRLAIVSPYTHEKLYQFEPGLIYYADSVAVKKEVYEKRGFELKDRTLARARKHIGNLEIRDHRVGYRPFVDGFDFGYAAEVRPGVWAVNGGGKNGIVAYANAASQIIPQIKERLK